MEHLEMEILSERVMQDGGISLPLRLPGGRHIRWVMRVPTYASLLNIGRMYLKLGVRYDEVKEYDFEQKVEFITRHGVGVSRMVACGIVRGRILSPLLNRPVAWMLRHWMHPAALEEAWIIVVRMFGTVPFGNIIRLAETINPMSPLLSHGKG